MIAKRSRFSFFPYIPFLFFSYFLAVVGMFAFEYLAHGKTSTDPRSPALWGLTLALFVVFTAAHHLVARGRNCSVCRSEQARDLLVENGKKTWLCRKDLVRRIEERLPQITGKWLVFAPAFEKRDAAGYVYCFEPLRNFRRYFQRTEQSEYALTEIGRIKGKCRVCGQIAEVSFFDKGSVVWEQDGAFDVPDFSRLQTLPRYLCKRCAAQAVAGGIEAAACDFQNGVLLPDGTDGVIFPWQV